MFHCEHLSGQELLNPSQLLQAVTRDKALGAKGPSPFFGGISFPPQILSEHFAVLGSTGGGKSLVIDSLLNSLIPQWIGGNSSSMRLVVYDAKGDGVPRFASYGLSDQQDSLIITNPFDARCSSWKIGKDIDTLGAAIGLSEMLVPTTLSQGTDAYWVDRARGLVLATTITLMRTFGQEWTLSDLFVPLFFEQDILGGVLAATGEFDAEIISAFSSLDHISGLKGELRRVLYPILPLVLYWEKARKSFSVKDFLSSSKVLLLGVHYECSEGMQAINQFLFSRLVDLTCAKNPCPSDIAQMDRTIFVLDELPEMGKLSRLPKLLSYSRQMGGCAIIGAQSLVQLETIYGREALSLLGNCTNVCQLTTNCPTTAEWASGIFGSHRVRYELSSQTRTKQNGDLRQGGDSNSTGTNTAIEFQPLVPASDVMSLPRTGPTNGLTGYYQCRYGSFRMHQSWDRVMASIPKRSSQPLGHAPQPDGVPQMLRWPDAKRAPFEKGISRFERLIGKTTLQ